MSLLSYYRSFWNIYRLAENARLRQNFSADLALPPVSLIISWRDGTNAPAFWQALSAQTHQPAEIFILLENDETLNGQPSSANVLSRGILGWGALKNRAVAACQYPRVAFIHSDCLPAADWLEQLARPLSQPGVGFSLGQVSGRWPSAFYPGNYLSLVFNLALNKNCWARVGGFPEDIPAHAADMVFAQRLMSLPTDYANSPALLTWMLTSVWRELGAMAFVDGELGLFADRIWQQTPWALLSLGLAASTLTLGLFSFFLGIFPALASLVLLVAVLGLSGWKLKAANHLLAGLLSVWRFLNYLLGVTRRSQATDLLNGQFARRLEEILREHPDRKGVILYPPTHDWGYMFQRPHQIARQFARAGYLFFYCTKNDLSDTIHGFQQVEPGLYLVSTPAVPPETFLAVPAPLILYLGAAWHVSYIELFPDSVIVYDHYDDLKVSGAQESDHAALLAHGNVILASSKPLIETVRQTRSDVLFIPNAVDYDFVLAARPQPADPPPVDLLPILSKKRPIIGYSGALAEWFDYPMLAEVALAHPEWEFVLLGVSYDQTLEKSGLLEIANIHWLGQKAYNTLFGYIWRFDVAVIPFLVNEITFATSPIKLFEYFACQKPVVSTPLPECQQYPEVLTANTANSFAIQIEKALELGRLTEYNDSIRQIALANTWASRVHQIEEHVQAVRK